MLGRSRPPDGADGDSIMHMADALLSPTVGLALWSVAGTALVVASRRVRERADDRLVPLMGMLGAFVFAAQMVNFTIPATGSSGHLGGSLLLAILLGPHAAFIVIASVLTVQALFFADGGLLALGANMFNMGLLPCFVAYPLIYLPLAGPSPSRRRAALATMLAAVIGLQLGALGVVLQTTLSGISSLPLVTFALLMLPIHLAIGVVEGIATAAIVQFLRRERPELLDGGPCTASATARPLRTLLTTLACAALLTGGVLSWFASTQPDGLEWSVERAAANSGPGTPTQGLHGRLAALQRQFAWLPGYDLPVPTGTTASPRTPQAAAWPSPKPGTSLAGVVGGAVTLALVMAIGFALRRRGGERHVEQP
jgi:cobalt/nickel transport system permease protein